MGDGSRNREKNQSHRQAFQSPQPAPTGHFQYEAGLQPAYLVQLRDSREVSLRKMPLSTGIDIMYVTYLKDGSNMQMSVMKFRSDMADPLNKVAYAGERVVLHRRGKPVAAVVSMDDLKRLEAAEDKQLVEEALAEEARSKAAGEKPIAFDEVERRIDSMHARSRKRKHQASKSSGRRR